MESPNPTSIDSDVPGNSPMRGVDPAASLLTSSRTLVIPSVIRIAAGVIIIAAIFLARDALIPIALSLLLSFLLAPLVARLRRWGLSRIFALLVSVSLATGIMIAVASFVSMQLFDLATNLPTFQTNIEQKIESLRATPDGTIDRVLKMVTRLSAKVNGTGPSTAPEDGEPIEAGIPSTPKAAESPETEKPIVPVVVEEKPRFTPMGLAGTLLNSTLGPLTTAGMVLIFVIFVLLEREEIRNRVIRMLGNQPGQIYTSTQALDDAASRVSRYLQMQLIVNVTYGIPIGIGLYFIGVPNPLLWGFLAVVLRFIPYLGPVIAAACPIALAFAVDPGWSMLIWTTLLYVVVEIISNNFIETWLYGTSTGISSVGILLSAVFWAWMWGPIGLLMSTPLTVCFVVLGTHIPAFRFFTLALGDQPVLPLHGRIYQRLLAMDPDEPDELILKFMEKHTVEELFETVILPMLQLLESERLHTLLNPAHRNFILEQIREMIEGAADHEVKPSEKEGAEVGEPKDQEKKLARAVDQMPVAVAIRPTEGPAVDSVDASSSQMPLVVCVPAHDETDELASLMLAILLRRAGVQTEVLSADTLASERLDRIAKLAPSVVCISALPPYATFHARHSLKRIRARLPGIRIIVGFWDTVAKPADLGRKLLTSGTDKIVTSLKQALEELTRGDVRRAPKSANSLSPTS